MGEVCALSEENGLYLLNEFERILESDPLIDEVGFVHPSQFALLNATVPCQASSDNEEQKSKNGLNPNDQHFWCNDHKLGISVCIVNPLYKAAKDAFMSSLRQYKCHENLFDMSAKEIEVMRHSKMLLLLNSDFGSAWNSRKLIVSNNQLQSILNGELLLSSLVLSFSPKCEQAWSHRRWVIKMNSMNCVNLEDVIRKESDIVEGIAERSKMNYRAWSHRCWLISYMPKDLVLQELRQCQNWAELHVADNSCFHYRRRLLERMLTCYKLEGSTKSQAEFEAILMEELNWNEILIRRCIGREALWLHRRLLSFQLLSYWAADDLKVNAFMDDESRLVNSCKIVPDNLFDDFQVQALHASAYLLWLTMHFPVLQSKLSGNSAAMAARPPCPSRMK